MCPGGEVIGGGHEVRILVEEVLERVGVVPGRVWDAVGSVAEGLSQ